MLVATDTSKGPKTEPDAPAVTGQVAIGSQSRIVIEPGDETVSLYYLLDILNNARAPVNPTTPFVFDMPAGANCGMLDGSSPQASVSKTRVQVQSPFAPGRTVVQVACELPVTDGSLRVTQRFPATLEQLAVIVKKVGDTKLTSPQIASQQDMTASGETFIAATGKSIAAGQPLVLSVDDLPHHSAAPRLIALSLVAVIIVIGVWASQRRNDVEARAAERKRLVGRREKLLNELVRLEHDRRKGKLADSRYASRREDLVTALEHVYGALDTGNLGGPGPAGRSGLAA